MLRVSYSAVGVGGAAGRDGSTSEAGLLQQGGGGSARTSAATAKTVIVSMLMTPSCHEAVREASRFPAYPADQGVRWKS
jgi:hypothetical protein